MIAYGNPGWGRDTRNIQPLYEPAPPLPEPQRSCRRGHSLPIIVDGVRYPSISSAACALSLGNVSLAYALRHGKSTYRGHKIAYAS